MNLQNLRSALEPYIRGVLHFYWRFARGMTLGVRAMVLDDNDRVFLVKHTYVAGWHLPGGGVEVGETVTDALTREVWEEGHIELTGPAALHGIFFNRRISRRDHVALYVVRQFRQQSVPEPNREIVACGFYALDSLPPDTTRGTRLRIAEVLEKKPLSSDWS